METLPGHAQLRAKPETLANGTRCGPSVTPHAGDRLTLGRLLACTVVTVSLTALILLPDPYTAMGIGAMILAAGLLLREFRVPDWRMIAGAGIVAGAFLSGGGIITADHGSTESFVMVAALLGFTALYTRNHVLPVLAVLALAGGVATVGNGFPPGRVPALFEPFVGVTLFGALAAALFGLARLLDGVHAGLVRIAAHTSVYLANLGFWVGSLWEKQRGDSTLTSPASVFAVSWAVALLAAGLWAWRGQRRRGLNTAAGFAALHLATQWFARLGVSPGTVFAGTLLAVLYALGIKILNIRLAVNKT